MNDLAKRRVPVEVPDDPIICANCRGAIEHGQTFRVLNIHVTCPASPIPPIVDPLGASWKQPSVFDIRITKNEAFMTQGTFERLAEYSATKPSGVYEGKMWRRHDGKYDYAFLARGGKPEWLLCWYGASLIGPGYVSNHHRKIVIVENL